MLARTTGRLGVTPPGFDTLLQGVGAPVQNAWQTVQTQLSAENAASGVIYNAQQRFMDAYSGLSDATGASSVDDITNVANAAASVSLQVNSIAGKAALVENLIQGVVSGNAPEVVQALGGSLCAVAGAAIAASTVSFGVGGAIILGIAVLETVVSGLFSKTPPAATICGVNLANQPGIVVNCAWSQGKPTDSGTGRVGTTGSSTPQSNPFWRRFPLPSRSTDAWWFQYVSGAPFYDTIWTSGSSSDEWGAASGARPIDAAFPQYHQLECDASAASLAASLPDTGGVAPAVIGGQPTIVTYSPDDVQFARFIMAYFGAWQANAEFFLNGTNPNYASDRALLDHILNFWNDTHTPGQTRTLTARNTDQQSYQDDVIKFKFPSACAGGLVPGGVQNEWWYVSMLLNALGTPSITIYTGPKISVPNVLAPAPSSASAGSSTPLIVGGLLAAAAGGVYLYGRKHHMTFGQTLHSGWDRARHTFGGRKRR